MNTQKPHFHFIGICGIGMSGIAKILLQQGFTVSGCDAALDPQRTIELEKLGCKLGNHATAHCHNPAITTLVYSSDIAQDHPELVQAKNKNLTIQHRAQVLAAIMQQKNSIAIAGAHGKTTTTALMAHILLCAQLQPTIMIGGHMHSMNSNAQAGAGTLMVAEADESDRSFLLLPKQYTIVTNIDREHLNTYTDFDDIKNDFVQFMNSTQNLNIICLDDPGIQSVLARIKQPVLTYGTTSPADVIIKNVELFAEHSLFELQKSGTSLGTFELSLPGMHNVYNATGVIALALELGIQSNTIKNALKTFQGVDRRFTFKGISKKHLALIYDDYGHHPRELEVTIAVAQKKVTKSCQTPAGTPNKIIMVFQPQRFSRTQHLWSDFVRVLSQAPIDHLIITDIYPANEKSVEGITSQNLVSDIQKNHPKVQVCYIPFDDYGKMILQKLDEIAQKDDLILFQGAGKVNKLAKELID
jgi:UDP-N-acetylmuramate--alanine ligase